MARHCRAFLCLSFALHAVHAKFVCMIELRTPYGSYDLAPDTQISMVELNNALEWTENFNLERSYPFTLPWTDRNAQLWKNADAPESHDHPLSLQCDLVVNGNTEFRGKIYLLRTVERKSYSVTLAYDKDEVQPDKLLAELEDLTPISVYNDGELFWVSATTFDEVYAGTAPYTLPVIKQELGTYTHINHYDTDVQQYFAGYPGALQFRVVYVLQCIAQAFGLKLEGIFDRDEDLQKLILFNMRWTTIGSYVSGGTFPFFDHDVKISEYMPNLSIATFFNILRLRFGLGVKPDAANGKLLFWSCREYTSRRSVVDVTAHVAQMGYMDIKQASDEYNFAQQWDEDDQYEGYYQNVPLNRATGIVSEELDLLALGTVPAGTVYLVTDTQFYYAFNGTIWSRYAYKWNPNLVRNETYETITDESCSLITSKVFDGLNPVEWRVPWCNYPAEDMQKNVVDFGVRFLLYHGMQDSDNTPGPAKLYPFASIDSVDTNGNLLGSLDLRDEGEYGQYERYKKYRNQLRSSAKAPIVLLKNDVVVQNLQPNALVRIQSTEYAWTEKTRTYDMKGLVNVELKLVKL